MTTLAAPLSWRRLEQQDTVFAAVPLRRELQALPSLEPARPVHLHVYRNTAGEPPLRALPGFPPFAGLDATASVGAWDDSFALLPPEGPPADLDLVWWDRRRSGDARWLAERVAVLRARSDRPVLVIDEAAADCGSGDDLREALAGLP